MNRRGAGFQKGSDLKTAKEMAGLGKLSFLWKSLVGQDLASVTYPARLIRGKLIVSCLNSAWLHTFRFIQPQLLEKVGEQFPELFIQHIFGKLGGIPEPSEKDSDNDWPDWRSEDSPELPACGNQELRQQVRRCQQKLQARNRALFGKGFSLCRSCHATMVQNAEDTCAICSFHRQQEVFMEIQRYVIDTPWITLEEIQKELPNVCHEELGRVKNSLAVKYDRDVTEFFSQWENEPSPVLEENVRRAMITTQILISGVTPDQIDLKNPPPGYPLRKEWQRMLNKFEGEATC